MATASSQRHKVLEEILHYYLDFSDYVSREKVDHIVYGRHADKCPWWERVNIKVPRSERNKEAPCTCGFLEEGPITISFSDLDNILNGLSKRKKEAVWLRVILGLKQWEAGKIMGINPVTVGQYVKAAMKQIEKQYFAEDSPNHPVQKRSSKRTINKRNV